MGDENVMFVKNLPFRTSVDEIRDLFPTSQDVRAPKRDDGQIKGFAFVTFGSAQEVEDQIAATNGSEYGGMTLTCNQATPGGGRRGGGRGGGGGGFGDRRGGGGTRNSAAAGSTKVLFVRNLSYNLTEDTLRDAFEGAVSARILTHQDSGQSKGFGFVEFDSAEDAKYACESMQNEAIDGRQIYVDYANERGEGGGGRRGGGGGYGGGRGGYGGGDRYSAGGRYGGGGGGGGRYGGGGDRYGGGGGGYNRY